MVKNKQKAFSLMGVIMILLMVFLMMALSMPLITKKHQQALSESENHVGGKYICYYDTLKNQYINEYYLNENLTKQTLQDTCTFEMPPSSSNRLNIQLTGGGSGGGGIPKFDETKNATGQYFHSFSYTAQVDNYDSSTINDLSRNQFGSNYTKANSYDLNGNFLNFLQTEDLFNQGKFIYVGPLKNQTDALINDTTSQLSFSYRGYQVTLFTGRGGQSGETVSHLTSDMNSNIEITLGQGGEGGNCYSGSDGEYNPINCAGGNGGDSTIKFKTTNKEGKEEITQTILAKGGESKAPYSPYDLKYTIPLGGTNDIISPLSISNGAKSLLYDENYVRTRCNGNQATCGYSSGNGGDGARVKLPGGEYFGISITVDGVTQIDNACILKSECDNSCDIAKYLQIVDNNNAEMTHENPPKGKNGQYGTIVITW